MTPQEIVHELDRHIIGQADAKRAVAIALRNRWRRQQVAEPLRQEITPKNILMIGPTGVGKTEIARRLARLADAPFIKIEATKFTEVGYVGRDVDTIIRDLAETAIKGTRETAKRKVRRQAEDAAEERVLDVLLPPAPGMDGSEVHDTENTTRQKFRKKLREGDFDDKEIEIEIAAAPAHMEILAPPGMEDLTSQIQGMFQNLGSGKKRTRKLKVREAMRLLTDEEAAKLVNDEELKLQAVATLEFGTGDAGVRVRRYAPGQGENSEAAGNDRALMEPRAGRASPLFTVRIEPLEVADGKRGARVVVTKTRNGLLIDCFGEDADFASATAKIAGVCGK